ncbi:MAG TPA: late competence development ComFB family protein [Gemmatimonadales bacterium]|nr:late competence development ComFB family protein [Gemmatimonadales bacterium]
MIRNVVAEHVAEHYKTLHARFPTFCGCDTCEGDVQVFALNRLPAKYVSTKGGGMIMGTELELGQGGTDIDIILLDGFRKVGAAPRCGAKPVTLP